LVTTTVRVCRREFVVGVMLKFGDSSARDYTLEKAIPAPLYLRSIRAGVNAVIDLELVPLDQQSKALVLALDAFQAF